ncbi:MAG: iron export ABC transporter permease subunit FetB [FCB group bacterium]|nr:iron export ABC transporter permease subunit FetB [FCB group bacterium]
MIDTGYTEVGFALILMALAIVLARWQKIGVGKDLIVGTIRSFVQLVAIGYALEFIFGLENLFAILGTLTIMTLVGSYTAASWSKKIPNSWAISFIAIFLGTLVTLGLMLAIGIIRAKAQYIIPLGGMIVGNSMNCAALVLERLHSDISGNRSAIETALSLGKTWREASAVYFTKAVKAGMMQMLNFFKVVGLVQLPGAMTGMILAGASPLKAVLIQVIVGYMLTAAVTITGLIAAHLAIRQMFSPADQLKI